MSQPIGIVLWILSTASIAIYTAIMLLSPYYALSVPLGERPLLIILALYGVACGIYFVALRCVTRMPSTKQLGLWIVGTSLLIRCLLLPTPPFQEIDIYRYLWDGAVVCEGVDPYAYPPELVADRLAEEPTGETDLDRLVRLARSNPALEEIVGTIHYGHLPSPYPPVSQAVFAAAAASNSAEWSATGRLIWLKGFLTLFDMATLLLVMQLLRRTGRPIGWALAYGWCPLVLKEVAGSGHLDSIATFFATAAVVAAVEAFVRKKTDWPSTLWGVFSAMLLALGVAAKLYPLILAPLLAVGLWRRFGFRPMALAAVAFVATASIGLAPMLGTRPVEVATVASDVESLPPPPETSPTTEATNQGKTAGIATFLQKWEMNDLLFMIAYENLRWRDGENPSQTAWFDVTPNAWSQAYQDDDTAAFFTTRVATLIVFMAIVAWLIGQTDPDDPSSWLRAAFLTLAWFFLLAPTQNPWYWCWAVPLLPFVRSRVWVAMSAAGFAYYLRFWLKEHYPDPGFSGTPYDGQHFFYYVIPWLEWGILLAWLAVESLVKKDRR